MSDLEVLSFCQNACTFLSEKYFYESGLLFQAPPSHNAVRALIDRCLKESMRVLREESNAHVIAGAILYSFKSLKFCVIHECLESIALPGNEITENYLSNKAIVDNMLQSLSPSRLLAYKCLIELILKVLDYNRQNARNHTNITAGSDISMEKMVVFIAPHISKPYNTAFLSIRHKEMIPKVKAILHYSLQNAAELFTPDLMTRRKEDTLESAFIEQEQAKCQEIHEIHQKETSSSMGVSESGTGGYGTPFHVPTNSTHVFNTPFQCNEQAVKEESTAGNDVEMSAVSNDGKYPDLSIDLSTTQTQTHAIPQGGDEGQCTPTSPRARAVHQQQQRWEFGLLQSLIKASVNTFTYHSPSDSGEKKSDSLGVGTPQTNRPVLYKSDNVGMSRSNEGRQKHRSPLHTLLDEQLQYDHVAHNSSHSKEGSRFTWGGGGAGVHAALKENTNTGNASSSSGSTSINGSSGSVTAGMAKRTSSSRDVSSSTGSSKKSRSSDDNNHKSKRRVSRQSLSRRQAVSECRVLKEAITSFEASFKDNYGRAPKSADRGEMQQTYDRYKDMKRRIRDAAATDIQKIIRSYRARLHVRKLWSSIRSQTSSLQPSLNLSTSPRQHNDDRGNTRDREIGGNSQEHLQRMSMEGPLLKAGSTPSLSAGTVRDSNEFIASAIPSNSAQRLANRMLQDSTESLNSAASSMDSLTMDDNEGIIEKDKERSAKQGGMSVSDSAEQLEVRAALNIHHNPNSHPNTEKSVSMNTTNSTIFDLGVSTSVDGVSTMSISGISQSQYNTMNSSSMNATNSSNSDQDVVNENQSNHSGSHELHQQNDQTVSMLSMNNSNPSSGDDDDRDREKDDHTNTDMTNVLMSSLEFDAGLNVNQMANIKASSLSSSTFTSGDNTIRNSATSSHENVLAVDGPQQGTTATTQSNYDRYLLLLQSKRDLKKKLKTFDEDFLASHGRMPRKQDKEVMRPYYQRYHDLKDEIDALKAVILAETGTLPDDALANTGDLPMAVSSNTEVIDKVSLPSPGVTVSMSLPDGIQMGLGSGGGGDTGGDAPPQSDDTNIAGNTSNTDTTVASIPNTSNIQNTGSALPDESTLNSMSLSQLNTEKKNLHQYLKTFEKQFLKEHGRPVTKQEDIAPVSTEYRLYKQLKALIQDRNAA